MASKILPATLLILGLSFGMAPAADQNPVDFGRWSETELAQLITTTRQIEAPGERIAALSSPFLATPYVADTLIGGPQTAERLVVNLAGVDCFTFLDTVEALRRATDLADFPDRLRQVRYRDGLVAYANRRHFFSDWVTGETALIGDVTATVGQGRARVVVKQLNRKSDGTLWLPGIPVTRRALRYIPANQIDRVVLSALQTGDYVGIYSAHAGLDVSHTGLIVKDKDRVMLRHASSLSSVRRVVDVELAEYLQGKPGLVVYRVN
jgi:hypothetical protein